MLKPNARITKFLTPAGALLIAVTLGLAGCTTVEYVPPSQDLRQRLGTVAVLSRSVDPSVDIDEPVKGAGSGALVGAGRGAAGGFRIGGEFCTSSHDSLGCTLGLILGVVLAVPGALVGSAVGAGAAHSSEEVEAATENLVEALMDAKPDQALQKHLFEEVMTKGPRNLRPLETKKISTAGYYNLAAEGFDSVLEIEVRSLEVHVAGNFDPDISPKLRVQARLVRTTDDTELYRRAWLYWGAERNYFRMATANAQLLREDLEYGYKALAKRMLHDLFRSDVNEHKSAPEPGRIVTIEAPTVRSDGKTE